MWCGCIILYCNSFLITHCHFPHFVDRMDSTSQEEQLPSQYKSPTSSEFNAKDFDKELSELDEYASTLGGTESQHSYPDKFELDFDEHIEELDAWANEDQVQSEDAARERDLQLQGSNDSLKISANQFLSTHPLEARSYPTPIALGGKLQPTDNDWAFTMRKMMGQQQSGISQQPRECKLYICSCFYYRTI